MINDYTFGQDLIFKAFPVRSSWIFKKFPTDWVKKDNNEAMASSVRAISNGGLDQHLTLADGASNHSSCRGVEAGTVVSPMPASFYQNGFVVCRVVQFSLSISKYWCGSITQSQNTDRHMYSVVLRAFGAFVQFRGLNGVCCSCYYAVKFFILCQ